MCKLVTAVDYLQSSLYCSIVFVFGKRWVVIHHLKQKSLCDTAKYIPCPYGTITLMATVTINSACKRGVRFNRSIGRSVSDMDKNFRRAFPTRICIRYTLTFLLVVSTLGTSNQGMYRKLQFYTELQLISIINEVHVLRSCIELVIQAPQTFRLPLNFACIYIDVKCKGGRCTGETRRTPQNAMDKKRLFAEWIGNDTVLYYRVPDSFSEGKVRSTCNKQMKWLYVKQTYMCSFVLTE